MKIIELDIVRLFENIKKDDLIKKISQRREKEFLKSILKKMHQLVLLHGDSQSISSYAFDVSRYLGGAISPKELERMYRKQYMNESQLNEWGRIVKGVNTTVDVGTDEIKRQAAKFGNTVDRDGKPPTLNKKIKGKSTNVLYNLGLTEGYKLQLERDRDLLVLHIKNTETGRRTEVRGKPGYETDGYDPDDNLHQLLDTIGKTANISELMNGEVVTINPKHPDAERANAATHKAYHERFTPMELALMEGGHSIEENVVEPKKPGKLFTTLEALDQPYPVRWSIKKDNEWYGHAKEDDFYNQIGIAIEDRYNDGRWTVGFKVGDKMSKTGQGDQFKIFATVKAAVQEWWKWASKNAQVDQITFSAEKIVDSSRSKLYHRFARQFARAIGYEMSVFTGRATDIFYLKKPGLEENFADGKKKGKSRPGRFKRAGVSCKGSVTDLRRKAKNSSGERQKGFHWCANMKSGRKKK